MRLKILSKTLFPSLSSLDVKRYKVSMVIKDNKILSEKPQIINGKYLVLPLIR